MRWWTPFGLSRMLTERTRYSAPVPVETVGSTFRRSLFVYPIDAGNSNALNMEIAAMKTAQYNVHRLGIFFTDSPRHADLFLLLGDPLAMLSEAIESTLMQAPRPFGVLWIRENGTETPRAAETAVKAIVDRAGGVLVAVIDSLSGPGEIIGVLQAVKRGGGR